MSDLAALNQPYSRSHGLIVEINEAKIAAAREVEASEHFDVTVLDGTSEKHFTLEEFRERLA